MFQLLSRGGIYLAFIVGVIVTWVMNRYFKEKPAPIVLPDAESKTEADFIAALSDKDWHLRLWGAQNLVTIATENAIPALVKTLQDLDPDVREAAIQAIIPLKASHAVLPLLQAPSLEGRESAVKVLAAIRDEAALEALSQAALNDSSAWVRIPAIEALSAEKDSRFLPLFSQILDDPQKEVYAAAKAALTAMDSRESLLAISAHPYQAKPKQSQDSLEEID